MQEVTQEEEGIANLIHPASQTMGRRFYSHQTRVTSRGDRSRASTSLIRVGQISHVPTPLGHGDEIGRADISGNGEFVAYTGYRVVDGSGWSLVYRLGSRRATVSSSRTVIKAPMRPGTIGQSISYDGRYVVMAAYGGTPDVPIIADMATLTAAPLLPDDAR